MVWECEEIAEENAGDRSNWQGKRGRLKRKCIYAVKEDTLNDCGRRRRPSLGLVGLDEA